MKFYHFLLTVLFISLPLGAFSQDANTLFFMRGVPQNYQVNPAFQPDCNFFLGLPGLAPLKVSADNSSFGLNDVFQYSSRIDSLVTFLHPDGIGAEEFLSRLDDNNSFSTEFSTSMASFGFRYGKSYFTFDIRERMDFQVEYSDDYLAFPIHGPGEGDTYNMALGLQANMMNEFALGFSHKITDQLTVGIRGKLLFGQFNVNTERLDLSLQTSSDSWVVGNDISINTSAPFLLDYINFAVNAPIDAISGEIEDFDPESVSTSELLQQVFNPSNLGLGLDMGVDYRFSDKIQLSASLVDLGSVKWKDDMVNFQTKTEYVYEGIEVSLEGDDDFTDSFLDSLENSFDEFTAQETEYRKFLHGKLYLGGAYYVHPKISLGLLSRTHFFNGKIRQQFTASANLYPIRMLSTSFSYSIINKTYKNIGFGLALKAFPFNLYLLTDTGPSVYFFPTDARYLNFKVGFNLMLGCKKEKKYDVPLIE